MRVHRIVLGQVVLGDRADRLAAESWSFARDAVDGDDEQHVVQPGEAVTESARGHLAQQVDHGVDPLPRQQIGRRALQHGHMAGFARHRGDHADRGRAAADHHDPFAGVIQRLGPQLGMHHRPGEVLDTGEVRPVGLVVVVVAGAEEQEARPVRASRTVMGGLHCPHVGRRIPIRREHPGVELDVAIDVVLVRGVDQIGADVLAVGDVLRPGPRLPRERQREDVAVGADTGIAVQVPGAPDGRPSLQDGVTQLRVALLDPVRRTDPGDARSDDQDVGEVVCRRTDLMHPQPPLVPPRTTIWVRARTRRQSGSMNRARVRRSAPTAASDTRGWGRGCRRG